MQFRKFLVGSFVVVALKIFEFAGVDCHGYITFPRNARNVKFDHGCENCANGEGACGEGNQWIGDVNSVSVLNGPYKSDFTTLKTGGILEVDIVITAAHVGHFVMELCRPTGTKITHDCFTKRLLRDPTDTRFGPYLPNAPHFFFFPDDSCATPKVRGRFIVPADYGVCDHCILRWFWQTGNSCASLPETQNTWNVKPSAEYMKWSITRKGKFCKGGITNNDVCGVGCPHPGCNGERFANCVDVKIVNGGSNPEPMLAPGSIDEVENVKGGQPPPIGSPDPDVDTSGGVKPGGGQVVKPKKPVAADICVHAKACSASFNQKKCEKFCSAANKIYEKNWC